MKDCSITRKKGKSISQWSPGENDEEEEEEEVNQVAKIKDKKLNINSTRGKT